MMYETEDGWYCREFFDVDTEVGGIECTREKYGEPEVILYHKSLDYYEVEDKDGRYVINEEELVHDIEHELEYGRLW